MELNLPLPTPSEPTASDTAEDVIFDYSNTHVNRVLGYIQESGDLS